MPAKPAVSNPYQVVMFPPVPDSGDPVQIAVYHGGVQVAAGACDASWFQSVVTGGAQIAVNCPEVVAAPVTP